MKKFYFTFGDSEHFPFKNGWIIIKADNMKIATDIFRKHFPDYHEGIYNFSFSYDEQEWQEMNPEENWKGWKYYGEFTE